jgi:hypothetical protein
MKKKPAVQKAVAVKRKPKAVDSPKSVCDSVRGIWKGRMSTDEIMKLTRGESCSDAL